MGKAVEKERLVREYLDHGDKEAAIKLLFELVVLHAGAKDFEAAEAARARIFDIDSMALGEIVGAGDIIEEEKYRNIDKMHRDIWAKLYQDLSNVEANALYFALKKAVFQAGETIFRQGEFRPRLYFIESGRVKIVYFKDGNEILLKNVESGRLAGEDTFFLTTLCTTTMVALSRTELSYLDSDILRTWTSSAPLLESKLQSFASKTDKIPDLLKAKAADRRILKRILLTGKAAAHLMNQSGNQIGKPFKVNMCDISRGGAAFYVRIPKRETADLLLGKKIHIGFIPPQLGPSHMVEQDGTIVALRFNPFEDCTISVKFDSLLPEPLIGDLERTSTPPQALTL
jgi:CRP-like cAMP-binding protein